MRPAPITPACVQVGITGTRRVALHVHRIASGLTDVQHPIGQSHADRAPPTGDAGAARAGQLQRIGGHGQRRCGDAQAHHGPDPEIKTSRGSARGGTSGRLNTTTAEKGMVAHLADDKLCFCSLTERTAAETTDTAA